MSDKPIGPERTPFDAMGHDAAVALATRFYDYMDANEPALVATHPTDATGTKVAPSVRERFSLFLVQWLGGPEDYSRAHGHPRLRMRHADVPIDLAMRDAWLRCMNAALEDESVPAEVRDYLRLRFAEVASFLRNRP